MLLIVTCRLAGSLLLGLIMLTRSVGGSLIRWYRYTPFDGFLESGLEAYRILECFRERGKPLAQLKEPQAQLEPLAQLKPLAQQLKALEPLAQQLKALEPQ